MNFIIRGSVKDSDQSRTANDLVGRRNFFRKAGIGLASAGVVLAAACTGDDDDNDDDAAVNLGSGDVGILNYAYALEQLEAAFYAQVLQGGYYNGANDDEREVLADLEAHERAHREFFEAAIRSVGATPIADLSVDFSSIDFSDRTSVLTTAQTFEDLGVAAYNGAGRLLENVDYLALAGKIVSVEARHASVIRDLLSDDPTAFAGDNIINPMGLDRAMDPTAVLMAAGPFITTRIDASNLPG